MPHGELGVLLDGEEYFRSLERNLRLARHSIDLLGWDFHTEVPLVRGEASEQTVLALLIELAAKRRELRISLLIWDSGAFFGWDRERFARFKALFLERANVHIVFDNRVPLGACHHQKVVVIDNAIAYCGGLDITAGRWDSHQHLAADPRRRNPAGDLYPPFHDACAVFKGPAVRTIAGVVRERWRRQAGRVPVLPEPPEGDDHLELHGRLLRDVNLAVLRTFPPFDGYPAIREIEEAYCDLMRMAQRYIYIENQYFTIPRLADLLAERLAEENGPEVVLILPGQTKGWLETAVILSHQTPLLERLRSVDRCQRLRIFAARASGEERFLKVHSKLMAVDDRWLMIGSANLNQRSMSFDTECNLLAECPHGLDALVAEFATHLSGGQASEFLATWRLQGSLLAAFGPGRLVLHPAPHLDHVSSSARTLAELGDLETPLVVDEFLDSFSRRIVASSHALGVRWRIRRFWFAPLLWGTGLSLSLVPLRCFVFGICWRFAPDAVWSFDALAFGIAFGFGLIMSSRGGLGPSMLVVAAVVLPAPWCFAVAAAGLVVVFFVALVAGKLIRRHHFDLSDEDTIRRLLHGRPFAPLLRLHLPPLTSVQRLGTLTGSADSALLRVLASLLLVRLPQVLIFVSLCRGIHFAAVRWLSEIAG